MTYQEFLQTKIEIATESGFDIEPSQLNKALKPHQRAGVAWALRWAGTVRPRVNMLENVEEFKTWGH